MNITRFINGKKFDHEFSKEIIIDCSIINDAIEKVNSKLDKNSKSKKAICDE